MYKTILVPLDGSQRAEAILPHVQDLAGRGEAKVIILYVEEPSVLLERDEIIDMDRYWQERRHAREEIEAYAAGIIRDFKDKNISAQLLIGQGPVVRCIIETASQEGADLVAMASHGRGAIERTFYGSVAAGVLQRIDRPLLLIRSRK
jgi:nucleotide-binding universal stress UspA family protein